MNNVYWHRKKKSLKIYFFFSPSLISFNTLSVVVVIVDLSIRHSAGWHSDRRHGNNKRRKQDLCWLRRVNNQIKETHIFVSVVVQCTWLGWHDTILQFNVLVMVVQFTLNHAIMSFSFSFDYCRIYTRMSYMLYVSLYVLDVQWCPRF